MKWPHQVSPKPTVRALLEPILKSHQTSAPPSSYAAVFQALTGTSLLKQGQQLHARFLLSGLRPDAFLSAKMVAMYASSGNIASASAVFHSASNPSTLLFNAIIRGLSLHKLSLETLQVHSRMRSLNFRGDHFTYPFVLKSAADLCFIDLGKSTHGLCLKDGLNSDMYVATSLIDMYVKCGQSVSARRLFDEMPVRDVSSWNALISGYMRNGAIDLATELFNSMPSKNIVSWTTMISGFTQNGLASQALQLFDEMSGKNSNIKPNWVTIMSVLPACGQSSALDLGKKIHNFARENRLDSHPSVQTALVGMYAKCGSLSDARSCFEKLKPSSRSLVTWNSMITAYASHGLGLEAVRTFEDMVKEGVHPDGVTFTGLLSGCSHSGLVDIGLKYFDSMSSVYFVEKRHEHYACTVDLLGRAGRLVEAYDLITKMPLQPEASVWGSLLASARCHRNLELAEMAARRLFVLEPENSGNYVVLSNMYAEAQMWAQVDGLRARLRSGNVKKNPGCSWIEIDGKAYLFLGGDVSHVQTNEIYLLLEEVLEKMKAEGYMPETGFALHDVSEEEKEYSLIMHSEKLAIAFGLINTEPSKVLRITKNLRICGDCHTTVKFISRIYGREIVVRDVNRFHHFREGLCSCDDYW